jgi:ATP-dependent RNA helicase DDX52/ROK1
VLLQSGSSVPEWMLKLPKPSKLNRRKMGKVKRGNEVDTSGRIGKADAIRKR